MTMNAAAAITAAVKGYDTEPVYQVPLDQVHVDPNQPRKIFNPARQAEINASVKEKGVKIPILLRPRDKGGFWLVWGERRVRAARAAEFAQVPAFVRVLTDQEAYDEQVLENGQREDLHPLEEADAYEHMRAAFKRTPEEIAAKTGKPLSHIRQRLQLVQLGDVGRKAFTDGKMSGAIAIQLARIPDQALRDKAEKEMVKDLESRGEDYTAADARRHIRANWMLKLADAPFDTADAELVVIAGSCAKCPMRTGNQRELFADVIAEKGQGGPDLCTSPGCWETKVKATLAQAEAKGLRVLTAKEAKTIFPDQYSRQPAHGSGYVASDQICQDDGNYRPWAQLMGKHAPPPVLARDHEGKIQKLFPVADARKAVKANGHNFRSDQRAEKAKAKEKISPVAKAKADVAAKVGAQLPGAVAAKIVAAAEQHKPDAKLWRAVARLMLRYDDCVAARREPNARAYPSKALGERIGKMDEAQLRGLIVELALGDIAYELDRPDKTIAEMFELLSVDVKTIKAELQEKLKAEAEAAEMKKHPAAKLAPSAKKKGGRS